MNDELPNTKGRILRLWYECESPNKYGVYDKEWVDIDITHCINQSGKFDPNKIIEDISLITDEDIDKYDRYGN